MKQDCNDIISYFQPNIYFISINIHLEAENQLDFLFEYESFYNEVKLLTFYDYEIIVGVTNLYSKDSSLCFIEYLISVASNKDRHIFTYISF